MVNLISGVKIQVLVYNEFLYIVLPFPDLKSKSPFEVMKIFFQQAES